ncbi:hypothetical protein, partial [Campylobacter peloridis]|uniref:hypothetical protein n=1 Tax=Campylobacter peloridis TaxID=488546 RepID=UPI001C73C8CA
IAKSYNGVNHNNTNFSNMKYVGIGSDVDWWHFAKGWNENEEFRRYANEYRLTNDIDFKGNQGKGEEGKDWQNYVNYCIDGLGCVNMIVGNNNAFAKNFDGQGYALRNIDLYLDKMVYVAGVFGTVKKTNFKNVIFENINLTSITWNDYIGGFIGWIFDSSFENIHGKNIKVMSDILPDRLELTAGGFTGLSENSIFKKMSLYNININNDKYGWSDDVGGFVGISKDDDFSDISIKNVSIRNKGIHASSGGFAGYIYNSIADKIKLNNIKVQTITNKFQSFSGGFTGNNHLGEFGNIILENIFEVSSIGDKNIINIDSGIYAGGFTGSALGGKFNNIILKQVDKITSSGYSSQISSGGFAGNIESYASNGSSFENIFIDNVSHIESEVRGDEGDSFAGGFVGKVHDKVIFNNIYLNNFGLIQAFLENDKLLNYAGGFAGKVDINFMGDSIFDKISINKINKIYSDGSTGGYIGGIQDNSIHKNISLNDIEIIEGKRGVGGFAGIIWQGEVVIDSVVLNKLKNIKANKEFAGGFVGYFNTKTSEFKNIYLYLPPSFSILSNEYKGIFFGKQDYNFISPNFNNIHIYLENNSLFDDAIDKKYWNISNSYTSDKINIHTYTDDKQGYINFEKAVLANLAKEGLYKDENGNLVFTTAFNVEKPTIT